MDEAEKKVPKIFSDPKCQGGIGETLAARTHPLLFFHTQLIFSPEAQQVDKDDIGNGRRKVLFGEITNYFCVSKVHFCWAVCLI